MEWIMHDVGPQNLCVLFCFVFYAHKWCKTDANLICRETNFAFPWGTKINESVFIPDITQLPSSRRREESQFVSTERL